MDTYSIGAIARRSGFTASTLRYYEDIGLVEPAARTPAGYRVYDDSTLARLAFIARAKQLGCSLDEITDLVGIWDGERCGPVQRRFHELVTTKLADAERQIDELAALTDQLRGAAHRLAGPAIDGPCNDDCACLTVGASVELTCTLDADEVPGRLELVERLRTRLDRIERTEHGLLLHLPKEAEVDADVRRFTVDEQRCCPFWRFDVRSTDDEITLRWDGPADATALLDDLHAYFRGDEALGAFAGLL